MKTGLIPRNLNPVAGDEQYVCADSDVLRAVSSQQSVSVVSKSHRGSDG
ncbi:MAG: hypothetical protein JWM68_5286 [Verrucomicrobiales bacterium]|nr:hypothetical protein [Verrucomicrobiales bacterium]